MTACQDLVLSIYYKSEEIYQDIPRNNTSALRIGQATKTIPIILSTPFFIYIKGNEKEQKD